MEQKKYYLQDIESGHSYQVSKEHYEKYLELWDSFIPKPDPNIDYGKLLMFGTRGEMDKDDFVNFEKLYKSL